MLYCTHAMLAAPANQALLYVQGQHCLTPAIGWDSGVPHAGIVWMVNASVRGKGDAVIAM